MAAAPRTGRENHGPREGEACVSEKCGSRLISSGRCKVLPRAITRSSVAWDPRRGATCVLEAIRQIIDAPAGMRRICGPYQKGNAMWRRKHGRVKHWAARTLGWPSPLLVGEGSSGGGYRVGPPSPSSALTATARREGEVRERSRSREIGGSLGHRKGRHKARSAEIRDLTSFEKSEEAIVVLKAGNAAGAKGLYLSRAFEEGRAA